MQTAQELLEKMASFDPGDALVLSVYLDMRPHAVGESPALRHVLADGLKGFAQIWVVRVFREGG